MHDEISLRFTVIPVLPWKSTLVYSSMLSPERSRTTGEVQTLKRIKILTYRKPSVTTGASLLGPIVGLPLAAKRDLRTDFRPLPMAPDEDALLPTFVPCLAFLHAFTSGS